MLWFSNNIIIPLSVSAIYLLSLVAAQAVPGRNRGGENKKPKVSVGRFSIPFKDAELNEVLMEATDNETMLAPRLLNLFQNASLYYSSYNISSTPDEAETNSTLSALAQADLGEIYYQKYFEYFYNESNMIATYLFVDDQRIYNESEGEVLNNPDIVGYFTSCVADMILQNYWYFKGAVMGVGRDVACKDYIETVISSKNEWSKLGSGTATTLMALIPTLLAFGSLYVPRNSEVYATSNLVGLTTALYTLGLPVRSISAIQLSNQHSLSSLGIGALTMIKNLGTIDKLNGRALWQGDIEDLRSITDDGSRHDPIKAQFADIRKSVIEGWTKRRHLWHLPNIAVAAAQVIMFALAIYPLFAYLGVPHFIFGCSDGGFEWTALYLVVSAVTNTLIRFYMWQNSSHEKAKAYALSEPTQRALDEILQNRIVPDPDDEETTATDLPPLYPTLVRRSYDLRDRIIFVVFGKQLDHTGRTSSDLEQRRAKNKRTKFFDPLRSLTRKVSRVWKYLTGSWGTKPGNPRHSHGILKQNDRKSNIVDMVKAGFVGTARSARRFRPVYLLIHLSTEGRSPIITLLIGMVEAALLLVLTFFFSAQWGGNLFITAVALSLLLLFITLGRALGLVYVWVSSRLCGLTSVQCGSADEVRGVLRILCSMPNCLVEVNGATYYRGHRMDVLDEWQGFLDKYNAGLLDAPVQTTPKKDNESQTMDVFGKEWKTQSHSTAATSPPSPHLSPAQPNSLFNTTSTAPLPSHTSPQPTPLSRSLRTVSNSSSYFPAAAPDDRSHISLLRSQRSGYTQAPSTDTLDVTLSNIRMDDLQPVRRDTRGREGDAAPLIGSENDLRDPPRDLGRNGNWNAGNAV